jgi:dTDP-4-dehydrorhamnose reductase
LKVLIIANDAQIGEALALRFTERSRDHLCLQELGIITAQQLPLFAAHIDVVINALNIESVRLAPAQLVANVSTVVGACQRASRPLIHLSDSQVFDPSDNSHRREQDPVSPDNATAKLLLAMEGIVRTDLPKHIILRTGPIFSGAGDNLMTRLLLEFKKAQCGETLSLSNSCKSIPDSTVDLSRVLSAIIDQLSCGSAAWGTYHYASSDPASHYHFAETALAVASQFTDVHDRPLGLQPTTPNDPRWSRPQLNCLAIRETFGIQQLPWRSFVVPAVKEFFERTAALAATAKADALPSCTSKL